MSFVLEQELTSSVYKGIDSKYFRVYGPHSLWCILSAQGLNAIGCACSLPISSLEYCLFTYFPIELLSSAFFFSNSVKICFIFFPNTSL